LNQKPENPTGVWEPKTTPPPGGTKLGPAPFRENKREMTNRELG